MINWEITLNWWGVLTFIAFIAIHINLIFDVVKSRKRIEDLEKKSEELDNAIASISARLLAFKDSILNIKYAQPMKGQTIPSKVRAKDGFGRPT